MPWHWPPRFGMKRHYTRGFSAVWLVITVACLDTVETALRKQPPGVPSRHVGFPMTDDVHIFTAAHLTELQSDGHAHNTHFSVCRFHLFTSLIKRLGDRNSGRN